MAYRASRDGYDPEYEKQRNDANNAQNVRAAADVAIASKNPYAMAAGGAVKAGDEITGGKVSESAGKGLTQVASNPFNPAGRRLQDNSNFLAESGASDKVGKVASFTGARNGRGTTSSSNIGNAGGASPNQVVNNNTSGGGNTDSLPSSVSQNPNFRNVPQDVEQMSRKDSSSSDSGGFRRRSRPSFLDNEPKKEEESESGEFKISVVAKIVIYAVLPFLSFIVFGLMTIGSILGLYADYDDAIGVSFATGNETGNEKFASSSPEQRDFYERINDVELDLLASGKQVDSLKVVAVFHVLNANGAGIKYDDMSSSDIREIADAMFNGSYYDEDTFKSNLINNIFPKYLPNADDSLKEQMFKDVLSYVDSYNSLIGKETDNSQNRFCSSTGANCSYSIKGYYIEGKGNVVENVQVDNLYVRLMQCGQANGHDYGGVFGKPLEGEELVPFEKYVLGVAYQEIGPSAPAEAIKAQMIAARSFILARHTDMGSWRTLQKEGDKWVLQAAACTQDQVYCDPDRGCSGTNGQWGQVYSGTNHNNGFVREPLPSNSPLRTYLADTSGEVLVNNQGYIIYTGYLANETNKFAELAQKGYDYRQILLQVYNQGTRNYGASNVEKTSCSGNSVGCRISNGDYTSWKQTGASWSNTQIGNSGKNIGQIGCLVTSIAMLISKSGVQTVISNFNPGTFVEFLSKNGGFDRYGNLQYAPISKAAPNFRYVNSISVRGQSQKQKLNTLNNLLREGAYVVAEVKGNTGEHWVAVDSVSGNSIKMLDPGSQATDMWSQYNWNNTSTFVYFKTN